MRNILKILEKNTALPVCVCALALIVLLNSCVKSVDNTVSNTPLAGLAVIDASPDAPAVNFYIGSSKITNSALSLGDFTNYFNAYSGQSSAIFYPQNSTTILAQSTITLSPSTYYTLFLANVEATPDLLLLKDSVYKPASGFTNVRFVDVSPDAPPVDLVVKGGLKIASNLSYKGYTKFFPLILPAGLALDTLQVVQSGTSTILATVPATVLYGTADYTIWFYGLANTTVAGEGLNAKIMEDVYYN